jgi:hypothetical protein
LVLYLYYKSNEDHECIFYFIDKIEGNKNSFKSKLLIPLFAQKALLNKKCKLSRILDWNVNEKSVSLNKIGLKMLASIYIRQRILRGLKKR